MRRQRRLGDLPEAPSRVSATGRDPVRTHRARSAMKKLRIVTLGLGTARQKMAVERWTNPKPQRGTCSPRYRVQSCRGKSAGVAKRPRERSPTRNPLTSRFATFASLSHRGVVVPAAATAAAAGTAAAVGAGRAAARAVGAAAPECVVEGRWGRWERWGWRAGTAAARAPPRELELGCG